ncbi:hypothetical protein ACFT30_10445 [Microbacterium ureisolvens]|uniref:hypothetical protein n=1 Tax=Microbacterium ureisolvens TaxID=2781186 RepID=UPI003633AA39
MELAAIARASVEDLSSVVAKELATHHRLLPPRHDYSTLLGHVEEIALLHKGAAARAWSGPARGDVVFARKGWRGTRPLTVMALQDAVAYRFLCDRLAQSLPAGVTRRRPAADFKEALLSEPDLTHIAVTDVTAYYEYVDHQLLGDELVAQTGDEPTVAQLLALVRGVMGRGVGLPQIHQSSDILGDTYIDPIRRRLRRRGFKTLTYSDDFRIGARNLSDARRALEICAAEMRELGLVQNERKTFTWSKAKYREDLDSFARAERQLFDRADELVTFWTDAYGSDDELESPTSLEATPIGGGVDESDVVLDGPTSPIPDYEITTSQLGAAEKALELWLAEDEADETQSQKNAAITQSLLGRALPILGAGRSSSPLESAEAILRFEPALTPQLASYLIQYAGDDRKRAVEVRDVLDEIIADTMLSDWQSIWIAHVAGYLRGSRMSRPHVAWLTEQVTSGTDAVAAHAAAALGNIGRADPEGLLAGVSRLSPVWRSLALWGLARVSAELASEVADDGIERILVGTTGGRGQRQKRGHTARKTKP